MSSIYNIATHNKRFKLYKGNYNLIKYNTNDSIKDLLYKYRVNNNLTFRDLASILNYSQSYICNVEKGTISPNKSLLAIVNQLIINKVKR